MSLKIQLHSHKEFSWKQPRMGAGVLDAPPFRWILAAPSNTGKSTLIADIILRLYRGCFNKICIFSPSLHIDPVWEPVKKYLEQRKMDKFLYDEYQPELLNKVVSDHEREVERSKTDKPNAQQPSLLVVCDDTADDIRVAGSRFGCAGGSYIVSGFLRGRHAGVSIILSTQVFRNISTSIRKNASAMIVFRQRNLKEKHAILEELSALVKDPADLEEMYQAATKERHSFLYVKLCARTTSEMFFRNFTDRLSIEDQRPVENPPDK